MKSGHIAVIAAMFITMVAGVSETSMIFVALPTLIREFGDPVTASWLITTHGLIGTSGALMAGRLGDIYGRKRLMLIMLATAVAGSVLSATTSHFGLVLLGRSLQGLAIATMPLAIGILRQTLPPERVPVSIGLMTTAQGMGAAAGLLAGGVIVDHLNWQWLFAGSAIMLGIAWLAVRILVPSVAGVPARTRIDWIEGLLPVPGISAILLGISLSKTYGWGSVAVIGLIAIGLILMAVWSRRALRAAEPFIDLRLFARRNVALANGLLVLLSFGTLQIVIVFSTYTQSPTWTMAGLGLSATVAALAKIPSNVLSFFAGPLSGWLVQTRGMRLPVVIGGGMAAAGWLVAIGLPGSLIEVILLLCVISFGSTILNAAIPNIIVASVPEERTSEAIGAMRVVQGMSAAVGAQIIAVFLATETLTVADTGAQIPSPVGFRATMAWIAALTIAATILAFLLRPRHEQPDEEQVPNAQVS